MRILSVIGFLAVACIIPALAQSQPAPQPPKPAQICIRPFDSSTGSLLRTHVVDPQTILFYMRDGKIWKNTLRGPCPGLLYHGFNFVTHQDEICSNAQSIQVIVTGEVCQLGYFTLYVPPPPPPPASN